MNRVPVVIGVVVVFTHVDPLPNPEMPVRSVTSTLTSDLVFPRFSFVLCGTGCFFTRRCMYSMK